MERGQTVSRVMKPVRPTTEDYVRVAMITLACGLLTAAGVSPANAAGCAFEPQGEGRVTTVIDARSFRLEDGREVRLAGIEPVATEKSNDSAALAAIIGGREVSLRGEDDTPDRYGRQIAFVYLAPSEMPVQGQLLAQGEALAAGADIHEMNAVRKHRGQSDLDAGRVRQRGVIRPRARPQRPGNPPSGQ